ncbi:MAG: hypothetical protein R3E86_11550 [Pseudomonadales bacterium]
MNPADPNVQLVEILVSHLGDLKDQFVFVGGCATGLLVTDPARPSVRATKDVDVVTEITNLGEYYQLAEKLRGIGFTEDPQSEVICRWKIGELLVDVMPTDEEILGFSNRWYVEAVRTASGFVLPSGNTISLISPPLFLATKLEAFNGRGNGDYGVSHDMEDIITLVDGRPEITDEVQETGGDVQAYLQSEFEDLLSTSDFVDSISWHLHGDADNQERATEIIKRLRLIAGV